MGKTIEVDGFPHTVTFQGVREYLERYTGSGTVYAMKKNKPSRRGSGFKVQFISPEHAELIISLVRENGWLYGSHYYLKAREMDVDLERRPKVFSPSMEGITLHVGCQTSSERLSVFLVERNVSVDFGLQRNKDFGVELNNIFFFLSHEGLDYKLDLSYSSVRRIQLHRPPNQDTMFLLIQLQGAPRIYVKGFPENPTPVKYFMGTPENYWVRTTDFTSSCLIGQSSTLCLELPRDQKLPISQNQKLSNFKGNFFYYDEVNDEHFVLETGTAYSCNTELVPMVCPPPGIKLPFPILYTTCSLVQQGRIPGPTTLGSSFYSLLDPDRVDAAFIEHALDKLSQVKDCCYRPVDWLLEQQQDYLVSEQRAKSSKFPLVSGLVYVRRAQITPSRIYFYGPEACVSNRVLRNFCDDIDNFLRVTFLDEELGKLHSTTLCSKVSAAKGSTDEVAETTGASSTDSSVKGCTEVYKRILRTLRNGVDIGDKKFEFLAFSTSQLRENSAWFFAPLPSLTAADIREWMGNFRDIKNVAKYCARLGQSFGSSKETLSVHKDEIEFMDDVVRMASVAASDDVDRQEIAYIPDIEAKRGDQTYVFSDGIGKISLDFAQKVATKCGLKASTPSAFQIRYAGYKGVVAVDPTSTKKLALRKSMYKYESENTKLDVLAWSKYQPCFLNRQIITLLSALGVEDCVFEKKQREELEQIESSALMDPLKAKVAMEQMPVGENTNILKEMLKCGYKPNVEPFLAMNMKAFRAWKLMDLRTRTRIYVRDGRAMMGCLDETATLEYGQAFVQASPKPYFHGDHQGPARTPQKSYIVEGNVVVAKNPCYHPGDVRVLQAIDVPALHHMKDCIVFPQKGTRPHPNECSGSDLDGDIYYVCWDKDLVPPRLEDPTDYTPPPTQQQDHDVTIEQVEEYFAKYIINDSLGQISISHAVFADREPKKAMSKACLQLAKLFSNAVDFPKTGVPVQIPGWLHPKEYPDFMEKHDRRSYKSDTVIGKLFREVKDVAPDFPNQFTREVAQRCYDPDMEYNGFEYHISDAFFYKRNYDFKLGKLMNQYDIKTEAEILSGSIIEVSKYFNRRRDGEAIMMAVRSLKAEVRRWFSGNKGRELDHEARERERESYAKASAWYYVTYHPTFWGCYSDGGKRGQLISFPWCISDKLFQIKRRNSNKRVKTNIREDSDNEIEIFTSDKLRPPG